MSDSQAYVDGHAEIASDAGDEIFQTLSDLPAYSSCDELTEAANDAGYRILDQSKEKHDIYNQNTPCWPGLLSYIMECPSLD